MVDHTHEAMDYESPTPATNADDLPAALLDRAITVLHNIMMSGGLMENWGVQKLDTDDNPVEELPDKVIFSHQGGNEKLRATISRDEDGYTESIAYAFAPDGSTYTTFKTLTLTRGAGGGVISAAWS